MESNTVSTVPSRVTPPTQEQSLPNKIPVPVAIRMLIDGHMQRVNVSLQQLQEATAELMTILGISPNAGWKLDMATYQFVKQSDVTENTNAND